MSPHSSVCQNNAHLFSFFSLFSPFLSQLLFFLILSLKLSFLKFETGKLFVLAYHGFLMNAMFFFMFNLTKINLVLLLENIENAGLNLTLYINQVFFN
jgi:hypothetical protein